MDLDPTERIEDDPARMLPWFEKTETTTRHWSPTQQWINELETSLWVRHRKLVIPLLRKARKSPHLRHIRPHEVCQELVFPTEPQPENTWSHVHDPHMSTFLLRGQEVPDWIYGFLSHQNTTGLPEAGTADEFKEGILAVFEQSAQAVTRRVSECLAEYAIRIITVEVDFLGEHITLHCLSDKPVMQINTIMCNKRVRKAMPSRARVCVNTHVEESRRSDDYLKNKPAKQEISREFFYEDGTIVRDEPQHWSAGMKHEPGDILRIGSIAHRVEDERDIWRGIAFDGDPVAGRDDPRRVQAGTPFKPGERAYWNAARNR